MHVSRTFGVDGDVLSELPGGVSAGHMILLSKWNVDRVAEEMTVCISLTFELGIGMHTCNPAFGRWRQMDLEFKANFSYIVSLILV